MNADSASSFCEFAEGLAEGVGQGAGTSTLPVQAYDNDRTIGGQSSVVRRREFQGIRCGPDAFYCDRDGQFVIEDCGGAVLALDSNTRETDVVGGIVVIESQGAHELLFGDLEIAQHGRKVNASRGIGVDKGDPDLVYECHRFFQFPCLKKVVANPIDIVYCIVHTLHREDSGKLTRNQSFAFFFLAIVVPFTPAFALSTSPSGAQHEKTLTAQSFLGEKLWIWQKRLSLSGWKIKIKMARSSELKPKTLGNIHWDADTHAAEINVLAPEDYKLGTRDMLADMEFTVVHELIHLQLSSLPRSEASRSAEEYAVNQITQALLNLDRR